MSSLRTELEATAAAMMQGSLRGDARRECLEMMLHSDRRTKVAAFLMATLLGLTSALWLYAR